MNILKSSDSGQHIAAGIIMMILAFAGFAILDTAAKYLMTTYGAAMVVAGRYVFALCIILAFMWRSGQHYFYTRHLRLHIVRGVLLLSATGFNFLAVRHLQLAQTAAIQFSNPLWVCSLSPLLLGETVGWRRWLAVLFGFTGVILIIQPGMAGFHWAMLASLASTLSVALYQIATRKAGHADRAMTSLFYSTLVGAILASPLAPVGWVMPDIGALGLFALMGAMGAGGHLLLTQAHRLAPASTLAPFVYTQILWMILAGFVVFGDVPGLWTLTGAAIVILSGIYLYHREWQKTR